MADGTRPAGPAQMRRVADDPGRLDLVGAPEGFDALVMADVVRARKGLSVFVARDGTRLSAFVDAFRFFAQDVELLHFPAWDCLPYDRVGPSAGVAAQRMAILSRLAEGLDGKPRLLATTAAALVQRVPPLSAVQGAGYSARPGNSVEIADLERYFAINGYSRASTVSEKGEFAIRGECSHFPTIRAINPRINSRVCAPCSNCGGLWKWLRRSWLRNGTRPKTCGKSTMPSNG